MTFHTYMPVKLLSCPPRSLPHSTEQHQDSPLPFLRLSDRPEHSQHGREPPPALRTGVAERCRRCACASSEWLSSRRAGDVAHACHAKGLPPARVLPAPYGLWSVRLGRVVAGAAHAHAVTRGGGSGAWTSRVAAAARGPDFAAGPRAVSCQEIGPWLPGQ